MWTAEGHAPHGTYAKALWALPRLAISAWSLDNLLKYIHSSSIQFSRRHTTTT